MPRVLQPRGKTPEISASREAEHIGDLRRQFITVPAGVPPGNYHRPSVFER